MTGLKAFISLGLMAYLFYRFLSAPVDREVLLTTLGTANYWYLLLALALFVLAIISNGVKWWILLRAQGIPVPLGPVTNYTFVGQFFNNFLPANVGGDLVKVSDVAVNTGHVARTVAGTLLDRMLGRTA